MESYSLFICFHCENLYEIDYLSDRKENIVRMNDKTVPFCIDCVKALTAKTQQWKSIKSPFDENNDPSNDKIS